MRIKLNKFFEYKLEAVSGNLFIRLLTPITLIPSIKLIFPGSEKAEFPPCSAAKSYTIDPFEWHFGHHLNYVRMRIISFEHQYWIFFEMKQICNNKFNCVYYQQISGEECGFCIFLRIPPKTNINIDDYKLIEQSHVLSKENNAFIKKKVYKKFKKLKIKYVQENDVNLPPPKYSYSS